MLWCMQVWLFSCLRGPLGAALVLICSGTLSFPAVAAVGDWQGDGNAQVRLISSGIDEDGRIVAGVEIELAPGWKTYWRTPGDAGMAPSLDFSASTNIAGPVAVQFPVPHRVDDGYAVTNVYEGYVVLPVSVTAKDPLAATSLALSLDIGVCAEICVPEHYDLTLDLVPGEADPDAEAILADARATLPHNPVPGILEVDGVVRAGGTDKRPIYDVTILAPDAAKAVVFIEGPADWFPSVPKLVKSDDRHATFSVKFSRYSSKTAIGGNAFTVTVIANGEAIEDVVALD